MAKEAIAIAGSGFRHFAAFNSAPTVIGPGALGLFDEDNQGAIALFNGA